jgi:hypothetical protein
MGMLSGSSSKASVVGAAVGGLVIGTVAHGPLKAVGTGLYKGVVSVFSSIGKDKKKDDSVLPSLVSSDK